MPGVATRQCRSLRALLCSLLLALAACGGDKAPAKRVALTVATSKQPTFALLLLAEDLGILDRDGVDLTLQFHNSGRDALKSALAGTADLATVYETPVVNHALQGDPVRVLTTLHRSRHNTGMVLHRERGGQSVVDLRGKRVGVPVGTNAEFCLRLLLRGAGMAPDDMEVVDLPPAGLAEALASGKVAAVVGWHPHLQRALDEAGDQGELHFSAEYVETSVLACTETTTQTHADAIRRVLRGLVQAEAWREAHPAEAVARVARVAGVDLTGPEDPRWSRLDHEVGLNHALLQLLTMEATWLADARGLSRVPDLRDVLHTAPLRSVAPAAVALR